MVIDLDSTEQEILDHVLAKSREDIVESPAVDENEVFPTHAAMLLVYRPLSLVHRKWL